MKNRKRYSLVVVSLLVFSLFLCSCGGSSQHVGSPDNKDESVDTSKPESTVSDAEAKANTLNPEESGQEDSTRKETGQEATARKETKQESTTEEINVDELLEEIDIARNDTYKLLEGDLRMEQNFLYVYEDFGSSFNNYTQKSKMAGIDSSLVFDMDENWRENPYSGSSCIRCEQITRDGDWGGWLFLNGYLPKNESVPRLNDGSKDGQGLDLTGFSGLTFYARGEKGGEKVEFFTCGFGYDGSSGAQLVKYPDSCKKRSTGYVTLSNKWEKYEISLDGADLSYVVCGFGYVLNDVYDGNADNVFYLDDIKFTGSAPDAPVLLRSYKTKNQYIKNAAFSYDNALVAMAFISEDRQDLAGPIVDAFVYAVQNDRALPYNGGTPRVRNAYSAGRITPFPGWDSGARLPGWYDNDIKEWYEDRYQVGSNVGNTSYVALALLQYYHRYGGDEYLNTAAALMDWVLYDCAGGGVGFIAGFDGWEEGNPPVVYPFTYKSIEHNIDAYAAFGALYDITGDGRYLGGAKSAKGFIESMYDSKEGLFMTGTGEDGFTPNKSVVVLDAQVWSALALGDEFEPYEEALKLVDEMKTSEGGYPFCRENKNGGWWAEGTAYTALMYRKLGDEKKYLSAMKALLDLETGGRFKAATVENLSTGMELFDGSPWEYSTDIHIAPAAWFIMAANNFNPYKMGG